MPSKDLYMSFFVVLLMCDHWWNLHLSTTSTIMSHADLPFSSLRSMARGWTYQVFWTNTCHQWHLHISDFNIFQGTSLDVKNTAAIQQAKVDLMIAKLWKVSWSTSQCIFYVICSIEWSPRLVCTIFIHYPFSFCWETSHNIPQTNNMRQTNVTRLTKFEQLEIRNPFFFTQKNQSHIPLTALFFVATLRSKWFF